MGATRKCQANLPPTPSRPSTLFPLWHVRYVRYQLSQNIKEMTSITTTRTLVEVSTTGVSFPTQTFPNSFRDDRYHSHGNGGAIAAAIIFSVLALTGFILAGLLYRKLRQERRARTVSNTLPPEAFVSQQTLATKEYGGAVECPNCKYVSVYDDTILSGKGV